MQPGQHAVHARHAVLRHSLQDAAKNVQRGLGGLLAGQRVQSAQGYDLRTSVSGSAGFSSFSPPCFYMCCALPKAPKDMTFAPDMSTG